ncbi:MAG: tRNA lysidine(34) synthetase TilS [Trueperaceae bacterium]|nr:tRNA lysidine(34) synthetase TilS [Trueperaceae bacterium]
MTEPADLGARVDAELTRLAPAAKRVVVAVSGGADSVAAARLLAAAGRDLVIAHFDHRLRPDSGGDAEFVRALSARLGAEFRLGGADVLAVASARRWNLEDAARRLRYAFLHDVLRATAARDGAIVVAHTLDDQAETFLLQLLRGAAFPGGMAARRGSVVRPLLGVRREELRAHLRLLTQAWREDATNDDLSRNRAWVRAELLPALESRFPGVAERIDHTASQLAAARAALERLARERFGEADIDVGRLAGAEPALRRAVIAARLRALGVPATRAVVADLEAALGEAARLGSAAPPWRRDLPRGASATLAYGRFAIGRSTSAAPAPEAPRAVSTLADLPAGAPAAVLAGRSGLVVRRRLPGDRIRLPGGTKLVSDLLIDRKVPRAERDRLRVIADGPEVLWVEGVAVAAALGAGAAGVSPEALGAPARGSSPPAANGDPLAPDTRPTPDRDARLMRLALAQARLALAEGEVPVGALVARGDEVLAVGRNRTRATGDPTAHAEIVAMRAAAERLGGWRLTGCTLYVTLEPCPMCFGAVLQSHVARVVFGAPNLRDGALGGVADVSLAPWKRVPAILGGVEGGAAARLLKDAFAAARGADAPEGGTDDPRQDGMN